MLNALTIDVEDYYMVTAFESVIRFEDWGLHESRVEKNTYRFLDLLDAWDTRATFFVLGWVAELYPHLVRAISHCGHEVASHGYSHRRIYKQTPDTFREETRRGKAILEDLTGEPVLGYRAASCSITAENLWALDILQEAGFVYDSSIYPIHHDLYGMPGYERFPHRLEGHGDGLIEFPLSTIQVRNVSLPIAGGGYFRLFPYAFTRWGITRLNRQEERPVAVYLHPWEIDPQQPRIRAGIRSRFRHYLNLHRTQPRLCNLLQDFHFGPMVSVLQARGMLEAEPV